MKKPICLLCSSKKFSKVSDHVRDSKKHYIIKCKKCQHVQLFPVPTEKELKEFYDKNLQAKNIKYFGTIRDYRQKSKVDTLRRGRLIQHLIPKNKKILEIGSGHGFFLEYLEKKGYKVIGTEVSKENRKIIKKISNTKLLDFDLSKGLPKLEKVNLIAVFHVLEHVVNPVIFLKNVKQILTHNGKLVIEVPNLDDYQLKPNESYRNWYWQIAHIHYFSSKILRKVLKDAGFKKIKIIGVQRYSIENMFNWKLLGKPQLENPTYSLSKEYGWIENYYKNLLEKNLKCDTIVVIASNN